MKSYKDLDIYKESKRLAIEIHKISLSLPKFELYEEGSQIRRSSKGVTAAIVEGYGRRRYKADFVKYLTSQCCILIFYMKQGRLKISNYIINLRMSMKL
jgi:hypothetical protein